MKPHFRVGAREIDINPYGLSLYIDVILKTFPGYTYNFLPA